MRQAQVHGEVFFVNSSTVPHAHHLQLLLKALGHSFNHVGCQSPGAHTHTHSTMLDVKALGHTHTRTQPCWMSKSWGTHTHALNHVGCQSPGHTHTRTQTMLDVKVLGHTHTRTQPCWMSKSWGTHTHALNHVGCQSPGAHTHTHSTMLDVKVLGAHTHALNHVGCQSPGAHTHTHSTMLDVKVLERTHARSHAEWESPKEQTITRPTETWFSDCLGVPWDTHMHSTILGMPHLNRPWKARALRVSVVIPTFEGPILLLRQLDLPGVLPRQLPQGPFHTEALPFQLQCHALWHGDGLLANAGLLADNGEGPPGGRGCWASAG